MKLSSRAPRGFAALPVVIVVLLAAVFVGAGYLVFTRQSKNPPATVLSRPTADANVNANSPVAATGTVKFDLAAVSNLSDFGLTDAEKSLLAENGFLVRPGYDKEFYPLYEENRYHYTPSLVTTDAVMHNYHLMFDYLLRRLEVEKLSPELGRLNASMLAAAETQYEKLRGTEFENAARRNVGFFAVASSLADSKTAVPDYVKGEVAAELKLIAEHQRIAVSPLMNLGGSTDPLLALKEDYSQYIPRGHYERDPLLQKYFKAMMWYGRLTFRFKNNDEVRSTLLINLTLNDPAIYASWDKIYNPTNFFVGKSDDIGYLDTRSLIENNYGKNPALATVASDSVKFAKLTSDLAKLKPPQINSIPIFNAKIQPDREKEIAGFRFMGQRYTLDADIFQRLVDREVPERMLPMGLDVPAAMGSDEALANLKVAGQDKFVSYTTNMEKMRKYIAALPPDAWKQNLYWGWLWTLKPLAEPKGANYPAFMQTAAWLRKGLETYLGSWTELKHDTILYAKQVYAEMGGGPIEQKDDRGYVEPNVEVYARLGSLLKETRDGLSRRGLLSPTNEATLQKMANLNEKLRLIAEKELKKEKLTDGDYETIRTYGGELEHFWLEANKEEIAARGGDAGAYLESNPAALVADVATDPNGSVLEEATGYVSNILAIVDVEGKSRLVQGGAYSYYEFIWPLSDRMTDSKWRDLLSQGHAPKKPEWTASFTAEQ